MAKRRPSGRRESDGYDALVRVSVPGIAATGSDRSGQLRRVGQLGHKAQMEGAGGSSEPPMRTRAHGKRVERKTTDREDDESATASNRTHESGLSGSVEGLAGPPAQAALSLDQSTSGDLSFPVADSVGRMHDAVRWSHESNGNPPPPGVAGGAGGGWFARRGGSRAAGRGDRGQSGGRHKCGQAGSFPLRGNLHHARGDLRSDDRRSGTLVSSLPPRRGRRQGQDRLGATYPHRRLRALPVHRQHPPFGQCHVAGEPDQFRQSTRFRCRELGIKVGGRADLSQSAGEAHLRLAGRGGMGCRPRRRDRQGDPRAHDR